MIRHIADDNPIAQINGSPIIADAIPSENIITIMVCMILVMITPDKMGAHNPLVRSNAVDRTVGCSVDPLGGLTPSGPCCT